MNDNLISLLLLLHQSNFYVCLITLHGTKCILAWNTGQLPLWEYG